MNVSHLDQDAKPSLWQKRGLDGFTGAHSIRLAGARIADVGIGSTVDTCKAGAPVLGGEFSVESAGGHESLLRRVGRIRITCLRLNNRDLGRTGRVGMAQDVTLCDSKIDDRSREVEILRGGIGFSWSAAGDLLEVSALAGLNFLQFGLAGKLQIYTPCIGNHRLRASLLKMHFATEGGGAEQVLIRKEEELSLVGPCVDLFAR